MWFPSQWQFNGPDALPPILCIWGKWTIYPQTTSVPINTAHPDRCEAFLQIAAVRVHVLEICPSLLLFCLASITGILEWALKWIIWHIAIFFFFFFFHATFRDWTGNDEKWKKQNWLWKNSQTQTCMSIWVSHAIIWIKCCIHAIS